MTDDPLKSAAYEAQLRGQLLEQEIKFRREDQNWNARLTRVLHSDRAAVDIGLTALRTSVLMNAGAVVALLAFVGQLWDSEDAIIRTVLWTMMPFLAGVILGGLGTGIAYFYQSFVSYRYERYLQEISVEADQLTPLTWLDPVVKWTAITMVGLVFAAYLCFIGGVIWTAVELAP